MGDECQGLLSDIADYLHGELDAERQAALHDHLDDCPPCLETADFQAQLRQLVAKRCGEPVPDEFKARVVAMLQVEVTVRAAGSASDGGDSAGPADRS